MFPRLYSDQYRIFTFKVFLSQWNRNLVIYDIDDDNNDDDGDDDNDDDDDGDEDEDDDDLLFLNVFPPSVLRPLAGIIGISIWETAKATAVL